jgi:hypothetical protein
MAYMQMSAAVSMAVTALTAAVVVVMAQQVPAAASAAFHRKPVYRSHKCRKGPIRLK